MNVDDYVNMTPYGLSVSEEDDFTKRIVEAERALNAIKTEQRTAKRQALEAYREEDRRVQEQFKLDALTELGLEDHPKADKLFEKAWEEGHSSGYYEVWNQMVGLADLLRD